MWSEPELVELERAWNASDAKQLKKLGAALGIQLTLAALAKLDAARRTFDRRMVLMAMADAMASEHGIGVREDQGFMRAKICLAAVGPRGLAIAIGHADNKGTGVGDLWPSLRPWYRELAKNRARVDAWLAEQDAARIELPIIAPPSSEPPPVDKTRPLIDAIVASPDDDTPRLVLADLLQQQNDPHGELITLMCLPDPSDEIRDRIAKLLQDHKAHIAGAVAERASAYNIERGFVESVTMNASAFSAHGERLFTEHPIRELVLRPVNADALAKLARTPALARVRKLELAQDIGRYRDLPLGPLLASPYFTRLEHLRFSHWHAHDWRKAFAKLDASALVVLEIYAGNFQLSSLIPMLTSEKFPRLARLDLAGGLFDERFIPPTPAEADRIAEAIATQTKLTSIAFDSDGGGLHPRHWNHIFSSPGGRALEAISWEDDSFDDEDLHSITVAKPCALRSLNLCRSGVHAEAVLQFLQSPAGARVERLLTWSSEAAPTELVKGLLALPPSHPLEYVGIGQVDLTSRFIDANVTDHPERRRRGWR